MEKDTPRNNTHWSEAEVEMLKAARRLNKGTRTDLARKFAPTMKRTEASLVAKLFEIDHVEEVKANIVPPPIVPVNNLTLPSEERKIIREQIKEVIIPTIAEVVEPIKTAQPIQQDENYTVLQCGKFSWEGVPSKIKHCGDHLEIYF